MSAAAREVFGNFWRSATNDRSRILNSSVQRASVEK